MGDITFYHHGIRGQKWGIRRYQNPDGSYTALGKKRRNQTEEDRVKSKREKMYKNVRTLSTEEISKQIERLKAEQTLKDAINRDLHPVRTAVSNVLKSTGGKVATTALTGAVVYAIRSAMTKKFDISEFANYVVPNPNKKK